MADTLFILIVCFAVGSFVLGKFLDYLNDKNWSAELPKTLSDLYDADEYKRSQEYDKAKGKLSSWSGAFSLLLILGMLFGGGFAFLDEWVRSFSDSSIIHGLLFFGTLFFAADLLSLPFGI